MMQSLILLLLATSVTSFSAGPPSCKVNKPGGDKHAPEATGDPLEVCVTGKTLGSICQQQDSSAFIISATSMVNEDPEKGDSIAVSIVSKEKSRNFRGFRIKLANAEEDIGTWSMEGGQTNVKVRHIVQPLRFRYLIFF